MLRSLALSFFFLLLVGCAAKPSQLAPAPVPAHLMTKKIVPVESLVNLAGQKVPLNSYHGKILLIHFWATWCVPCIHELRTLQNLRKQIGNDSFEILAVAINEDYREVAPVIARNEIDLPMFRDPMQAAQRAFGVNEVPESFFVSPSGHFLLFADPLTGALQSKISGARDWDSPKVVDQIRALIK